MKAFTRRKFLSLSALQQEKFLAEKLRSLWEGKGSVEEYNEWQAWRGKAGLAFDLEVIADRYHEHLRAAGLRLKEHRLLRTVREGDREKVQERLPWSVYLDNLRSAHNVGSIVRSAEAFGLEKIFFSLRTPFIDHKQVKDAAMGCQEWIECHKMRNFEELPRPIVAFETSDDALAIDDYGFERTGGTLAIGNEEYGCSRALLEAADVVVEIPLYGRKNSLNVANAFAVAAAAVRQQFRQKEKTLCQY